MIFSLVASTFAADLVIDPAGGGDFTTLQDAWEAAADGDTLYVRDGDYTLGNETLVMHSDGSQRSWGGGFVFDRSLTVVGESVDGVVVTIPDTAPAERMYAVLLRSGASQLSNLTIVHAAAGTTTSAGHGGLHYAYGAFASAQLHPDETAPAAVVVKNVVVVMSVDHDKTLLYSNGDETSILTTNVTVDFQHDAGSLGYINQWGTHSFESLIAENIGDLFIYPQESGGIGGEYMILHGSGMAGGSIQDADPMFEDPGSLDYRLQASSPGIDAGNPALTDADGSVSDLGAHGGPAVAFPNLDPQDSDPQDSDPMDSDPQPVGDPDGGDEGGCSVAPRPGTLAGLGALGLGLMLLRRRAADDSGM